MKKSAKLLLYGAAYFILMLLVQETATLVGNVISHMFSYSRIDPYKVFAPKFVHHIVQMLFALLIILFIKIKFKQDFGFKQGNVKTGFLFVGILTLTLAVFITLQNLYFYSTISHINYGYPLNAKNIIGSLAFQMLLSGPSEEILFRALPITLFIMIFGKSIKLKFGISLEVVIAALLFAFAHLDSPRIDFQIYYSFVLGIVYGVAYQKSESIFYPMLMHSISNVLAVGIGYLFYFFY